MAIGAPVLLVENKKTDQAREWAAAHASRSCLVLGGPTLISDANVQTVMLNSTLTVRVFGQ